jgi:hypothetical protein
MNARIRDDIGIGAILSLAAALLSLPAVADTTTPVPQPAAPPPASMPDSPRTVPEKVAPRVVGNSASPAVVVPKPMDPGIQVPVKTPTNDKMPVVKQAPAPDANTTVVPK